MKTITIDTGAAWDTTISTWDDGDVFRETNIDIVSTDIADRLGYLKATLDTKPDVSDDLEFTGEVEFSGAQFVVSAGDITMGATGNFTLQGTVDCDVINATSFVAAQGGVAQNVLLLSDAAQNIDCNQNQILRVPVLTANRIYTFNEPPEASIEITVTKAQSSAFTATFRRADSTVLAIIDASVPGWIRFHANGTKILVSAWSAGVSSINTDVS